MADTPRTTIKWVMRAGYSARGMIYTMVGGLAFLAALKSTPAEGTEGALAALRANALGVAVLWAIGAGLFAYLLWRLVAGITDVEDHGTSPKGLLARTGQIVTGLLHGVIGASVIGLAAGVKGGGGSGDSAQDWTQTLMAMPMGRYIVALAALILLGAGAYYARKGWQRSYREQLASSRFTDAVDPLLRIGLTVYGALLALVATSLAFAALTADPSQAGGLGHVLQQLRGVIFGRVLLGFAGLGVLGFALYNFTEAAFRVVPRLDGPDVRTLAKVLQGEAP